MPSQHHSGSPFRLVFGGAYRIEQVFWLFPLTDGLIYPTANTDHEAVLVTTDSIYRSGVSFRLRGLEVQVFVDNCRKDGDMLHSEIASVASSTNYRFA